MSDTTKSIWEQQEGEPNEAYARFLVYRNLGITRTLEKAYNSQYANNRKKSQSISGTWTGDATKWNWSERASAWDIDTLTEVVQRVVAKYINALDLSFQRILDALGNAKLQPKSWDRILDSITILGGFIPQETVATIRQNNASNSVPAIGRGAGELGRPETENAKPA